MIRIDNVRKQFRVRRGYRTVLKDINLTIEPGQKLGILGRNGSGKSTLIRLISGAIRPSKGAITRKMTVSWPLAFSDAFQENQTGLDCLRFICRVYGIKNQAMKDKIEFVEDFAELGSYFTERIKTYSSGMRARLSFAVSMAVDFDCFLIDEVVAVGDDRFHQKCYDELFVKRNDRAFVIVSHFPDYIKTHCDTGAVLENETVTVFNSVTEAHAHYYASKKEVISQKEVIAAYRFILGREPENDYVVQQHLSAHDSLMNVRKVFFLSEEYADIGRDIQKEIPINMLPKIAMDEDTIQLAYKLLLNREATRHELCDAKKEYSHYISLRGALMKTNEFHAVLKRCFF